jgi:hypothetical protein
MASPNKMNLILSLSKDEAAAPGVTIRVDWREV